MFAVVLSFVGCAHSAGPRPVNVHAVRVEIKSVIGSERAIISMGKVTEDSAEVFTEENSHRKQEQWVKVSGAWKLQTAHDIAASAE